MSTQTTSVPAAREPQLRGQTVVLIGGSARIGLETARLSRVEGADVILTGRDPHRLGRAAPEVGAKTFAAFDAYDTRALRHRSHHEQHRADRSTFDIDSGRQFVSISEGANHGIPRRI